MKIRFFLLLLSSAIVLTACAILPKPLVPPDELPFATPVPPDADVMPAFIQAARAALAEKLKVNEEQIVVISINPVDWPDACLGLPAKDEMCAQVITPGYRVMLRANNQVYEVHTGSAPGAVRIAPQISIPVTPVAEKARADLAKRLQVAPESISVQSVTDEDWPDSCLGISRKGEMCLQVIVPGYRVSLEHQGKLYVYRTNLSGSVLALEAGGGSVVVPVGEPVLSWESPGTECLSASISPTTIAFGPCGKPHLTQVWRNVEHQAHYLHFVAAFQSFEADTPAGMVQFTGTGTLEATPAEQRAVAEWAQLAVADAAGTAGGVNYGLALSWHREGGIAGFCDDLLVFRSGVALASSCRGTSAVRLGTTYLTAEQLEQLYTWLDELKAFEYKYSDPATADAMHLQLLLNGSGSEEASETAKQAMLLLCQEIFASIRLK